MLKPYKKKIPVVLSGIDNWLPALLLPLLPVLSRPCTCWMGRVLLSVLCRTHRRKHMPTDAIGAAFQIHSLLGHKTLGCSITLAGGDMTLCMFDSSTLTGHNIAHHLTCWSTTQHISAVRRWTCMPLDMWRCWQELCCWTRWSRHDGARRHLTWWNAAQYSCRCCMLTAGCDAVKSCGGGRRRQYTLHVVTLQVCDAVITYSASLNLLERITNDHIISAMHWHSFWKNSHGELSTVTWDGCGDEGYVLLHSLGEYAPASTVLCTIGLSERTCDVVRRRFSPHCQYCHPVYAMAQLLSPPHGYVIGLF